MKKILIASLLAAAAASSFAQTAAPATTESAYDKAHPRIDQVNDRLANQKRRIHQEVREGEMSKAKAARLRREDRRIHKEEHLMAAQNGGHITQQEQRTLNQQENKVSTQIGK